MNDCLFCKIISGEAPSEKIYENNDVFAFLDINPVSRGHFLIVPKEHATDLTSGSPEAATALMKAVYHLAPKVMEALGANSFNLGLNHGADAGQIIFHTHMHLMPRYKGQERKFERTHPSPEELAEVAENIRSETQE